MKREFAQRLKDLRLDARLSLDDLAAKTGISRSALCNYENGVNDITSDYLVILAKFFNVSTDYLVGLED